MVTLFREAFLSRVIAVSCAALLCERFLFFIGKNKGVVLREVCCDAVF